MKLLNIIILLAAIILLSSCSSSVRFSSGKAGSDNTVSAPKKTIKKTSPTKRKIAKKETKNTAIAKKSTTSKTTSTKKKSTAKKRPENNSNATILTGKASYYHDKFNGRKTANGEIFDNDKLTAAHKTLPFGTKVRVKNLRNNKTVSVVINDRGPFVAGRIIDLSRAAAAKIGMIRSGVAEVEVLVLE